MAPAFAGVTVDIAGVTVDIAGVTGGEAQIALASWAARPV